MHVTISYIVCPAIVYSSGLGWILLLLKIVFLTCRVLDDKKVKESSRTRELCSISSWIFFRVVCFNRIEKK